MNEVKISLLNVTPDHLWLYQQGVWCIWSDGDRKDNRHPLDPHWPLRHNDLFRLDLNTKLWWAHLWASCWHLLLKGCCISWLHVWDSVKSTHVPGLGLPWASAAACQSAPPLPSALCLGCALSCEGIPYPSPTTDPWPIHWLSLETCGLVWVPFTSQRCEVDLGKLNLALLLLNPVLLLSARQWPSCPLHHPVLRWSLYIEVLYRVPNWANYSSSTQHLSSLGFWPEREKMGTCMSHPASPIFLSF